MSYPALESQRLLLVPLSLEDVPGIQQHFAHWEIIEHLSARVPWPYPADGALTFVRDSCLPAIARGEQRAWAIRLKRAPQETVGLIDYVAQDNGYGNRGFWLAAHLHGQGYMTEAVTALQDYVFFELGIDRLIVVNARDNPASRRVKEKTGAVLIGEVSLAHRNGEQRSERWMVTAEAWRKLRGRP